jgi:hypothetical protein
MTRAGSAPRTLFITIDPPYPATSGAPLRNWQNISHARACGPVAVVSIGHDGATRAELPGVAHYRHITLTRSIESVVRGFPYIGGAAADVVATAVGEAVEAFSPTVTVFENVWLEGVSRLVRDDGRRLVYDAHNVYGADADELNHDGSAIRLLEQLAVTNVDDLWVCSDEDAKRMRLEYSIDAPLHVIPNGEDAGAVRAALIEP